MSQNQNNPSPAGGGQGNKSKSGMPVLITGAAIVMLVLLVRFVFMGGESSVNNANKSIDLLKDEKFTDSEKKIADAIDDDPSLGFIEKSDNPALANMALANKSLEDGDFAAASSYYMEAYKVDSADFDKYAKFVREDYHYGEGAYIELGNQFWNARNLNLAEKAYSRPLVTNSNYTPALTNLGNVATRKGDIDKAMQMYDRALIADPSLFEARVNMLSLALANDRKSVFDIHMNKLKEYYPDAPLTMYFMGEQAKNQKKFREAKKLFSQFLEKQPDNYKAKLGISDCDMEIGLFDSAQEILRELALHYGPSPQLKERALGPAEKAYQQEDYKKALAYYESMGAVWPQDPEFRFGQANCQIRLGNLAEARVILEDMLHYYPESSKIMTNLGLVYTKMGKDEWAKEQLEAAIAIDSPAVAFYNLGKIFENEGDSGKATSCYIMAAMKDQEMFDLEDFLMEIKEDKARRIAEGDTAGMIFLDHDKKQP
jgi:tetratricopeptide (TPR) repeat protein